MIKHTTSDDGQLWKFPTNYFVHFNNFHFERGINGATIKYLTITLQQTSIIILNFAKKNGIIVIEGMTISFCYSLLPSKVLIGSLKPKPLQNNVPQTLHQMHPTRRWHAFCANSPNKMWKASPTLKQTWSLQLQYVLSIFPTKNTSNMRR